MFNIANNLTDGSHRSRYSTVLGLLFAFLAYGLVKLLHVDTLTDVLNEHWQFLDLPVLFADPLGSLLYLHAQPPLLNFIAYVLHFFPGDLYHNFVIVNCGCVAVVALIICHITLAETKSLVTAIVLALAYLVYPSTLLYAGYPFYPCLTTFGYAILFYAFYISGKKANPALCWFVFAIVYLSLLRSSFSLLHTLFFMGLFYLYSRQNGLKKSAFAIAFGLALSLSLVVPLKNFALYGSLGTSSWTPLNLANGIGLHQEGGFFISPQKIKERYPDMECQHAYHQQDTELLKTNGEPNYNSCYVLEYAKIIKAEKFKEYKPSAHLKNFAFNSIQYFSPSDSYFILKNRAQIQSYANFADDLQITVPLHRWDIRLLLIILLVAAATVGVYRKNRLLLLSVVIVMAHYLSHALTDGGEGKRFVFDIEFIFFILFGLLFQIVWTPANRTRE